MPPEFEKRLTDLNIPFETRGARTIVNTYPLPEGFSDATDFSQTLMRSASETDARLISGEGDHLEFGPR